MIQALANARILTDEGFVDGRVVLVDGERIVAIVPPEDPRVAGASTHDLGGLTLLPGFIDTQVNGGGDVLFNDAPTVEGIRAIGAAHRRFGTTAFLPTLISEDFEVIGRAVNAVRDAIAARVPGVIGIHIEGPFINEARRGIHDAAKIRGLAPHDVELLTSLVTGRTLVTLAPELTTLQTLDQLARAGVVLSAGHTNGTFEEITDALRHGVTGVTHLFNAMTPLHHRQPGAVGAALSDPDCWCGIIVDGHHVHPAALKIALACKRHDRFMLVTGARISVRGGRCVDEAGTLAGSALDMASAVRNSVDLLDLPLEEAARMASTWPAEFLGLGHELGRIAPGYRARMVALDERLHVRTTWIDGHIG